MHWPCRQNCARNHETPTPVTDSVARPPLHISEERRSGQQSYGFKPSEITRASISYTQLHCNIESGTTCLSRPCNAPAPPRAGRTARRFGAPLTPRLARRPLCGEPLLPPTFRRRVAGVPPVRRGALRWKDSVSADFILADFQFQYSKLCPNLAPLENKVVASRRAEKCRSLRVKVEVGVSGCA